MQDIPRPPKKITLSSKKPPKSKLSKELKGRTQRLVLFNFETRTFDGFKTPNSNIKGTTNTNTKKPYLAPQSDLVCNLVKPFNNLYSRTLG